MIEFLDANPDVIALVIGGKIEGGELDAVMDRLEPMLASRDQVHVFVESRHVSGIAIDGLAAYAARAWPLFGQLRKFGRVAVVADQAWMRLATRLESAVLPGIGYRTFHPEQRDEAFAWVNGDGPSGEG